MAMTAAEFQQTCEEAWISCTREASDEVKLYELAEADKPDYNMYYLELPSHKVVAYSCAS